MKSSKEKTQRNQELLEYRMAGHSPKECAEAFHLTTSRVGQIVRRQSVIAARALSKEMAESGRGYDEISSTLLQTYSPISTFIDEHYAKVFARNALMAAGRFEEVELQSGFWTRCWAPQMEKSMHNLLEKAITYTDGDIISFDANIFRIQESAIFALALGQKFGYPIYCREEREHYFCLAEVVGRPVFIDVRGITTSWPDFTSNEFDTWNTEDSKHIPTETVSEDALKRLGNDQMESFIKVAKGLIYGLPPYTYDAERFSRQIEDKTKNRV